MPDKAEFVSWKLVIDGLIGDEDTPPEDVRYFTGIRAVGKIGGRKFVVLIPLGEVQMNDPNDKAFEEIARRFIKKTKIEELTDYD